MCRRNIELKSEASFGVRPASELAACRLTAAILSQGARIDPVALAGPGRCAAPVARARQAAMYLTHIGFGLGYAAVGRGFERDPSTVRHACARVEDWRDNPRIDLALRALETAARAHRDSFATFSTEA